MSTMGEEEYKCPICDEIFRYFIQYSYTTFGCFLDFKPFGAAEIPTPVPKCPKCNFIFDEDMFSKEEINIIRNKLTENNIFLLEPNMPNYYYLAKEFELLDKDIETIIYYYHSAIWESNNIFFNKIANIILNYFTKIDVNNKNYYIYQIIKVDFLRRLKKFNESEDLIYFLMFEDKKFPVKYWDALEYQIELIDNEDIEEHEMPREGRIKNENN